MRVDLVRENSRPSVAVASWLLGSVLVLLAGCECFPPPIPICQSPPEDIASPVTCGAGTVQVGDVCEVRSPNNYSCECTCPKAFAVGVRVATTAAVFPASSPGGVPANDQQAPGSGATVVGGPGQVSGNMANWWQLDFDTGPDGWVPEADLAVTDTLGTFDLDVCVPPTLNPNDGGQAPSDQDIANDCAVRAAARANEITGTQISQACTCTALDTPTTHQPAPWDASCDAPCGDASEVCAIARSDPAEPTPSPLSDAIFTTTSDCEVQGTVDIDVGGHTPETQPGAKGTVHIHGRRCPSGQICQVGLSYQLAVDDITFDSGSIFVDDPTIVDLTLSGATDANAVTLGPFLGGCCLGPLAAGTSLSSIRGRKSGSSADVVAVFQNLGNVAGVIVDWANKQCELAGPLSAFPVVNGDNGQANVNVDVTLTGVLVNQPPNADASKTKTTVECTSPQGATVTLDGSASTDADGNIAFYAWRVGSETGTAVAAPSANAVVTTQQGVGKTTYALQVVDARFAADGQSVDVSVVDTTKPTISCNAPATIIPSNVPDKTGISFKASASDVCSGVSRVAITSFACTKPQECKVQIHGDTITILNPGGIGDIISWIVSAGDAAGNVGQKTCQLTVVKK